MTTADQISFWSFKMFHLFLFVVIPIYFVGFSEWLVGFLVSGLFAGLVLSLVFQLAHTVEHTSFRWLIRLLVEWKTNGLFTS
ncbi:MAG: hypothetical protein WDO19_32520 [Bacteroidota bacterium]